MTNSHSPVTNHSVELVSGPQARPVMDWGDGQFSGCSSVIPALRRQTQEDVLGLLASQGSQISLESSSIQSKVESE